MTFGGMFFGDVSICTHAFADEFTHTVLSGCCNIFFTHTFTDDITLTVHTHDTFGFAHEVEKVG